MKLTQGELFLINKNERILRVYFIVQTYHDTSDDRRKLKCSI